MINYAHRGASEYAPENTLSSFYLGLLQGANGIETDVQKTKDGVLILFHDDTLDRVTDAQGKIADHTWEELSKVKVFGNCKNGFYDRIITLRTFLEHFAGYDIHFAIELKGVDVEKETLEMVMEFGILERVTFTSFQFGYIRRIKEMEPRARVGWLVKEVGEQEIRDIQEMGGEELAPQAELLTEEKVKNCRDAGLGVRAWGLRNEALMKQMCQLGVDGMTVNFPDKLTRYLTDRCTT